MPVLSLAEARLSRLVAELEVRNAVRVPLVFCGCAE
jgi:hypothetical protein